MGLRQGKRRARLGWGWRKRRQSWRRRRSRLGRRRTGMTRRGKRWQRRRRRRLRRRRTRKRNSWGRTRGPERRGAGGLHPNGIRHQGPTGGGHLGAEAGLDGTTPIHGKTNGHQRLFPGTIRTESWTPPGRGGGADHRTGGWRGEQERGRRRWVRNRLRDRREFGKGREFGNRR